MYAHADGTQGRHLYDAPEVSIQLWDPGSGATGRAQVTLLDDDSAETGAALYAGAVFVRRGSAVGSSEVTDGR